MTLLNAILKKVSSSESLNRKYPSPPPEIEIIKTIKQRKRKHTHKVRQCYKLIKQTNPEY